jgi:NMD protein affecting ribosome stability and mRNA decay
MIIHKMHLWDAVVQVRSKRKIFPNTGFLEQLCMLEQELYGWLVKQHLSWNGFYRYYAHGVYF